MKQQVAGGRFNASPDDTEFQISVRFFSRSFFDIDTSCDHVWYCFRRYLVGSFLATDVEKALALGCNYRERFFTLTACAFVQTPLVIWSQEVGNNLWDPAKLNT